MFQESIWQFFVTVELNTAPQSHRVYTFSGFVRL